MVSCRAQRIVEAGDWDITPRITVAEVYSDNINLDDDDKEYDLVTEISPGISVHGESARLRARPGLPDAKYIFSERIVMVTVRFTS